MASGKEIKRDRLIPSKRKNNTPPAGEQADCSLWQLIAENSLEGILVFDQEGKLVFKNATIDDFLQGKNISAEQFLQLLGGNYSSIADFYQKFQAPLRTGMEYDLHLGNTLHSVILRGSYLESQGSYIFHIRDAQERKQLEESLLKLREDMRAAFKVAKMATWFFDTEKQEMQLSDGVFDMLRTDAREQQGYRLPLQQWLDKFVHTDYHQAFREHIEDAIAKKSKKKSSTLTFKAIRQGGDSMYLSSTLSPSQTKQGKVIQLRGVFQDVTARERMNSALREKNKELQQREEQLQQNIEELKTTQEVLASKQLELERQNDLLKQKEEVLKKALAKAKEQEKELARQRAHFEALFNSTDDSITLLDREYRVILMNDAIKKRYRGTPYEGMQEGACVLDFLGEHKDEWKNYYDRALQGERLQFIMESIVEGNKHYREYHINPIYQDKEIIGVSVFSRDVTDRFRQEAEIKRLLQESQEKAELLQAQEEELRQNIEELTAVREKEAELYKELERSQSEMQSQLNAINQSSIFVTFDLNGKIVDANPLFLRITGYTIEELRHTSYFDLIPFEEEKKAFMELWQQVKSGRAISKKVKRQAKNGKVLWIDASYAPVYDEKGEVAKIIKIGKDITGFQEALLATQNFLTAISQGNLNVNFELNLDELDDELQKMAQANLNLQRTLSNILAEVGRVMRLAGHEGKLNERLQTESLQGVWLELANNINYLLDSISRPVIEIKEVLKQVAEGKLNVQYSGDAKGVLAEMADSLNAAIRNTYDLIKNIQMHTLVIEGSSIDMLDKATRMKQQLESTTSAITQMSEGAEDQVRRTDEVSKLIENILSSANQMRAKAELINQVAQTGQENCNQGIAVINTLVKNMEAINTSADQTAMTIETLTQRSEEISKTLRVITDIAFQTNLLALNAAIEAARAGEAGRGFAVVAEEIRKLAEQSKQSADDIEDVVRKVQKDTVAATEAIESMRDNVKAGIKSTAEASHAFSQINESSRETLGLAAEIVEATRRQEEDLHVVVRNIEKIVVVSEETAAGTQEVARASLQLNRQMEEVAKTGDRLQTISIKLKENAQKFQL
jgi:PAS domain S-box-containing protein